MASNMSRYLSRAVLDAALRGQTYTFPSSVWVALFKATVTNEAALDSGDITHEIDGVGYARINKSTAHFVAATDASPTEVLNASDFLWPQAGAGGWGDVGFVAVMDSDIGGSDNVLFSGAISVTKNIADGETFQFLTGNLVITLT